MTPKFMDDAIVSSGPWIKPDEDKFARDLAANGFAVIDLAIPNFEQLSDHVRASIAKLSNGRNRVQDGWRVIKAVRDVATNAKVMRLLASAYGRRPVPFQTLNFTVGTQQRTHSDTIHFDAFPRNFMCGVWVAYEDADVENGALHYYPGSHRLPIMRMEDFGLSRATITNRTEAYRQYEDGMASLIEKNGLQKHVASVKKGQAFVWTANLFHGGEPIIDKRRTRLSQVTHYYFADCLYTQPLWSDFHGSKIEYKKVFDIAEGRYVQSMYNGKPFRLPLRAHVKEFITSLRGARVI